MKKYYVYILTNKKQGTLYTGITNTLMRRAYEHRKRLGPIFTKKYNLHKLVYWEKYEDVREAISREKQIKRWRRDWKIQLIEGMNPNWEDFFVESCFE